MDKYFKGFLFGCIVCGVLWFTIGRPDIREIRQSYDRTHRDFEDVQRITDKLRVDSDGFAGDISTINITSKRIGDRSSEIGGRLTDIDGSIRFISGEVDKLEGWNKQSIQIGRDLSDVAFELRQINKKGRIQK
jgi:hypothetical protein